MHRSKRFREIDKLVDVTKVYSLDGAIEILKKCPPVKFDQSVGLSLKTGVDAQKSEQLVRGTVSLPNGTGKSIVIVVFAKGDKIKEALDAGADFAGNEDLFEKIKSGWLDFDAVIATPDMMATVSKVAKILGPRGLMPNPKIGTVTMNVGEAVTSEKKGKLDFRIDKAGIVHAGVGKKSMGGQKLQDNFKAFMDAIVKAKPATSKGIYIQSISVASTMGPGIKIDVNAAQQSEE